MFENPSGASNRVSVLPVPGVTTVLYSVLCAVPVPYYDVCCIIPVHCTSCAFTQVQVKRTAVTGRSACGLGHSKFLFEMKPGNDFHLLTWEARGDERANWELELKWFPLPLPLLYCIVFFI